MTDEIPTQLKDELAPEPAQLPKADKTPEELEADKIAADKAAEEEKAKADAEANANADQAA